MYPGWGKTWAALLLAEYLSQKKITFVIVTMNKVLKEAYNDYMACIERKYPVLDVENAADKVRLSDFVIFDEFYDSIKNIVLNSGAMGEKPVYL